LSINDHPLPENREFDTCIHEHNAQSPLGKDAFDLGSLFVPAGLPGTWHYAPPLALLTDAFKLLLRRVGRERGFEQWVFSRLVPVEHTSSFGCTANMPSSLVAASPNESNQSWQTFLDPVQCMPFYPVLKQRIANQALSLPWRVMEFGSFTYRNEQGDLGDVWRSREFLRAEFVFAGQPDDVVDTRSSLLDALAGLISAWNWRWRLVIGMGCYEAVPSHIVKAVHNASRIQDLPVIDLEVWDPFSCRWLEVAGATNSQDEKTQAFELGVPGLWSGCMGVGLTRLLYLFVTYFGTNTGNWPDNIARIIEFVDGDSG
jgi:seryl-tRNA synthetase